MKIQFPGVSSTNLLPQDEKAPFVEGRMFTKENINQQSFRWIQSLDRSPFQIQIVIVISNGCYIVAPHILKTQIAERNRSYHRWASRKVVLLLATRDSSLLLLCEETRGKRRRECFVAEDTRLPSERGTKGYHALRRRMPDSVKTLRTFIENARQKKLNHAVGTRVSY